MNHHLIVILIISATSWLAWLIIFPTATNNYRIIKRGDNYQPQCFGPLGWIRIDAGTYAAEWFDTLDGAERYIKSHMVEKSNRFRFAEKEVVKKYHVKPLPSPPDNIVSINIGQINPNFLDRMRREIVRNHDKGDWSELDMTGGKCLDEVNDHYRKLSTAIIGGDRKSVTEYCADLALIAMKTSELYGDL